MDFKEWILFAEANNLMKGFKGWYNYSRGDWNEVIAAAKQDPSIRTLIGQIDKNLTDFSQSRDWANRLEQAVERHFPNHSKAKARARWERERFGYDNGNSQAQTQHQSPTATRPAGVTGNSDELGYQLQSPRRMSASQGSDPDISSMVSDHERRLRNLEKFLKASRSALASNDVTASYA